jgi:hypothetical protein
MSYGKTALKKELQFGTLARRCSSFIEGNFRKYLNREAIDRWFTRRGRQEMEEAAYRLTPLSFDGPEFPAEVHFLTGKRFWFMTAFCCYSLLLHSRANLRLVFHSDGTLEGEHAERLSEVFPAARCEKPSEIKLRLDEHLPVERFPTLRERRRHQMVMRKLTDVHAGTSGWKIFLDSDMLFFRRPDFLLDWLREPRRPFYMQDISRAYGYSPELMSTLARGYLPKRLNSGMCGLNSDEIDWEQLDAWCREMIEREGKQYLQEQALTAMMVVNKECAVAPREDYIVVPRRREVKRPQAVMHHYAGDMKRWYFQYGWKHIARGTRGAA